jgi:hypothetical protein
MNEIRDVARPFCKKIISSEAENPVKKHPAQVDQWLK